MSSTRSIVIGAVGWTGHAFPAFALARALAGRGHRITVETFGRWRATVEELGAEFLPAREEIRFMGSGPSEAPSLTDAARELAARLERLRTDAVVSDMWTLAPGLAAELAGTPRATLIPHPYPRPAPGAPFYPLGLRPARSALGRIGWRAAWPLAGPHMPSTRLRRTRTALNRTRAELGLPPQAEFDGQISDRLALVATFPQLEYPREWPPSVHVVGPLSFELPFGPVDVPPGDEPLILVAPSTERDPGQRLVRAALRGLAREPVRVLATTNRRASIPRWEIPANARVVDWLSYGREMNRADAVVCHGGHGTLARALGAGKPVLVCPAAPDMAENGARASWAGAGLMVPGRLLGARAVRLAVRRLLGDPSFATRAGRIAHWARKHDGAERAADLVEQLIRARG